MSDANPRDGSAGRAQWLRRDSVSRTPAELQEIVVAERLGTPFLVWRKADGGPQQLMTLGPELWRLTIGRDPNADVSLPWDREASRTHALLERIGSGWMLIDDGLSRNGSFVNATRVLGRRRLVNGDRMCIGATYITFYEPVPTDSDSTAVAGTGAAALPLSPAQRQVLIALCE